MEADLPRSTIPNLKIEYAAETRIIIFRIEAAITRVGVDEWEKALLAYLEYHKTSERYIIYDMRKVGFAGMTPYMRQRLAAMAEQYPDATGRVAVVVTGLGPLRHLIEFFVGKNNRRMQPDLEIQFFDKYDDGLNWVLEAL